MPLEERSLTELRGIAQAQSVPFTFQDTRHALIQKINLRTQETLTPVLEVPEPSIPQEYTLSQRPLPKGISQLMVHEVLAPYVARGMVLTFPSPDTWHMRLGVKEDTGTLRQRMQVIIAAAKDLFRETK